MIMFRQIRIAGIMGLALLLLAAGTPKAQNLYAAKRSLLLPGLGQMSEGKVYRGLALMAGEVFLIHMGFNAFSKCAAYARETRNLEDNKPVYYDANPGSESLREYYEEWQNYYDKSKQQKVRYMVFWGLAGLLWAGNVADAYLFVPHKKSSLDKGRKTRIALDYSDETPILSIKRSF
jgi:hypothetical protein